MDAYTLAVEKSSAKVWATSAIEKNLPNVNNHPTGEKPPNLVTLLEWR
jgi:hypothetical protein